MKFKFEVQNKFEFEKLVDLNFVTIVRFSTISAQFALRILT